MNDVDIDPSLPVEDVMRRWPATIAVFLRHRMACVGCPVGAFHTIAESGVAYDISGALLLAEVKAAVLKNPSPCPRRSAGGHADR
jgi:hybrid cluster-associated redox disulfide protein